jgi:NADH-quinone oxidoreductase subunit M
MGVAIFANLGLPGLAGFVGEFLIMRGVWAALPLLAIVATIGLVVTAMALLEMYGRIFHGPLLEGPPPRDVALLGREFLVALPLITLLIVLGIYPALILDVSNQALAILAR